MLNVEETTRHLRKVWYLKGNYEIRYFTPDGQVIPVFFDNVDKAIEFFKKEARKLEKCNVFLGVNPRSVTPQKGAGRTEHVKECAFLFADIDFKEKVDTVPQHLQSEINEKGWACDENRVLYIKKDDNTIIRVFKQDSNTFHTALKKRLERVGIRDATLVVDSGFGYHVYVKLAKPLDRDEWYDLQRKFVEFLNGDPQSKDPARILRVAGTWNHKYPQYPVKCCIVYESDYEVDPNEITFPKEKTETKIGQDQVQKLTPQQKEQIVKLFLPYWDEGRRHALSLMLAGAFYWHGYPIEDATAVVKEICEKTKDEELKDRLRAVEDTYTRGEEKQIAYKSPDILKMMSSGINQEEYEKLVYKVLKILKGSFLVDKSSMIMVKKSDKTFIVADMRQCIIKEVYATEDKEGGVHLILRDIIATAVPAEVTVIQEEDAELLRITFVTSDGSKLRFEGDIEEITNQLKKMTVRVTSRRKIEDALSLIISKMLRVGLCKKVSGESVKGLILNDGKVVGIDYDTTMPDPHELKEGLKVLNEFVELSSFSKTRLGKIAKLTKWFVVSGLGWIYKQLGVWLPHCYIYGESDTGKTKSASFLSHIWSEPQTGSLGSIDSPYRFGTMISTSTFPVIINEMNFDELGDDVIELWKNAVEQKVARYRYGKKIKAYSVFCFTSNSGVPSERAIKKRLCIVWFDARDSETLLLPENRQKFESIEREKDKLMAIGRFVANWVRGHLDDLKKYSWEEVAEKILESAYEFAGLSIPEWVRLTDEDSGEDEDAKSSRVEEIRAFILNRLVSARVVTPDTDPAYDNILSKAHNVIPWLDFRSREWEVVLRQPLITELKRLGVKIGSLRDLAYYVPNSKYANQIKAGRSTARSGVVLCADDFLEWLGLSSSEGEVEDVEGEEWSPDDLGFFEQ